MASLDSRKSRGHSRLLRPRGHHDVPAGLRDFEPPGRRLRDARFRNLRLEQLVDTSRPRRSTRARAVPHGLCLGSLSRRSPPSPSRSSLRSRFDSAPVVPQPARAGQSPDPGNTGPQWLFGLPARPKVGRTRQRRRALRPCDCRFSRDQFPSRKGPTELRRALGSRFEPPLSHPVDRSARTYGIASAWRDRCWPYS